MTTRGWHHVVKSRKRAMATGKYVALVFGGGTLAAIAGALLIGLLIGAIGCYATTGPVPTCAQDPTQPQCPPPIHDQRAPDGGAR